MYLYVMMMTLEVRWKMNENLNFESCMYAVPMKVRWELNRDSTVRGLYRCDGGGGNNTSLSILS